MRPDDDAFYSKQESPINIQLPTLYTLHTYNVPDNLCIRNVILIPANGISNVDECHSFSHVWAQPKSPFMMNDMSGMDTDD